jgi:V8-like Glu-specific endopeptidase
MTKIINHFFLLLLVSCAAEPPIDKRSVFVDSCLSNVVNGKKTKLFPGVVAVTMNNKMCSGVFVSGNTLLTAAHCSDETATGGISYKTKKPVSVFHSGKVGSDKSKVREDLLVAVFGETVADQYETISLSPPAKDNIISIVGFGQTDFVQNNLSDGYKRVGTNKVKDILANETIISYESPKSTAGLAEGELAMAGRGDSGGGVFNKSGKLVGIVSRGSIGETLIEYDVNLFSKESLEILDRAEAAGGKVTGIENIKNHLNGIVQEPILINGGTVPPIPSKEGSECL